MPGIINPHEGRALFGADPRSYDAARPPYPEVLYRFLRQTGALYAGSATLEIGAGNGLASRRLLELGSDPLTLVEPDARFVPLLTELVEQHGAETRILTVPFEDLSLPPGTFDLVAAATSFHWLDPLAGLTKIARLLKPGGSVALWWNVFGDHTQPDPFHDATYPILRHLSSSPSGAPECTPFALDTAARLQDFASTGFFEAPQVESYCWTLVLDPAQVGALYATYSSISRLPAEERQSILAQLMEVAERQFGGRVTRNMISPIYVAKRKTHRGQ